MEVSESNRLDVFKFGGTSVGSAEAIRLALTRVREAAPRIVAVVSAMTGVTDSLLSATQQALDGKLDAAGDAARGFESVHLDLVGWHWSGPSSHSTTRD